MEQQFKLAIVPNEWTFFLTIGPAVQVGRRVLLNFLGGAIIMLT